MTKITRERLLKIQQWRETYGTGSNVMLPAEEAFCITATLPYQRAVRDYSCSTLGWVR
ncbi:hypothetical protein XS16_003707 [Salmonella enterica subsp. enterica serovar Newport]|nr:hypothetical protein [Salmonella enterica subsp. enterica serovar Newport]